MNLKNGIVSEKTCNFYYILGRGCPTSKSNYDWCLLLNLSLHKTSIWLTSLSVVQFSKFEILNRSTQKVTNNYQSVKIFKTVCDHRSRGRVFIPYCITMKWKDWHLKNWGGFWHPPSIFRTLKFYYFFERIPLWCNSNFGVGREGLKCSWYFVHLLVVKEN